MPWPPAPAIVRRACAAATPTRTLLASASLAACIVGPCAPAEAADICWQSGVTPEGHHYGVLYVPPQAIAIAASGQRHNYIAVAVALLPGWIWVAKDIPCDTIPWNHEERHLDGWVHDADGRWIGKNSIPLADDERAPAPWRIIRYGDGYRVVKDAGLTACGTRERRDCDPPDRGSFAAVGDADSRR